VLHGEIHGALEPLIPRIHDLAGEAGKRLLDVQILHRIVQIVETKPVSLEAVGDGVAVHRRQGVPSGVQ